MKKPTKSNVFYWLLKGSGIGISAALPLWAVFNKFPLWVENYGVGKSLGTGGIIGIIIALIIFRDTVIGYIKEKFKIGHAPKLTWWIVGLIIVYGLLYIVKFLSDLALVMWLGLFGSIVGTLLTFAGEIFFGEVESK
jgi:hypothetical protein